MAILPSYRSVWPIYPTPFFVANIIITVVCTVGVNYGVDYGMNKDKTELAVINGQSFFIGVLVVVLIIDFISFFGAGGVRQRIIDGKANPVAQAALCDTLFKRVFLFALAVPNWKDRLPRFIAQTLVFPGLFVVIGVYMICWFSTGCKTLPSNACVVPLHEYLAYTVAWKAVIAASVVTLNFAAAHNDAQPELLEAVTAASPLIPAAQETFPYKTAAQV